MSSSPTTLMGVGIPDKAANKLGNTIRTIAGVGTSQALGALLTVNAARLTTAGGATAFTFPTTWAVGDSVIVFNASATAALIYPQSGGAINGGSTDASVSVAQNTGVLFLKVSATAWQAIASSASITGSFTTLTVSGTIAGASSILSSSPTGGVGYATGAGGAVTQATNRTTGVTLSTVTGAITTNNASLAAEVAAAFTVTNTAVAVTDTIVLSQRSGSNGGNTKVFVSAVAAGSFQITVANDNAAGGTAETGAIIINFTVIKGVAA